ncbi:hypothetical protein DSM25558_3065 [Agrobacterium sp. DSM 25558]|nr:hypothetical protein DSM25558_3065 [Agrobacterium sp. DSM 25558]
MRSVFRSCVQCSFDDFGDLCIGDGLRPTRPVFVSQSVYAVLGETPAPLADCVLMDTEPFTNNLVGKALCTKQDHPASI